MDRINRKLTPTEKDEKRGQSIAYNRRRWLSLLLETGNEKVLAAYKEYDAVCEKNAEDFGAMPTSGAIGPVRPLTANEFSEMSIAEIADYLKHYTEQEIVGISVLTGRGLGEALTEYVTATPQRFTDNLSLFQDVRSLYQSALLQGFLSAWRDGVSFDWAALLNFIRSILLSERFWIEPQDTDFNYKRWVKLTVADLLVAGTRDDEHAFEAELLPFAEDILWILMERAEQGASTLDDLPTVALNSDKGQVFSAMVIYALRFARATRSEDTECRWPYAIRADFTKRLDRDLEPALEFRYTLGRYLPNLLYLDKRWVSDNIDKIFPQENDLHWRAAFTGYLYSNRIHAELYTLLKGHGHYHRALHTDFSDTEVPGRLAADICRGWIAGEETLADRASLMYALIHSGNPNLLSETVYFFSPRNDSLSEKAAAQVKPIWRELFNVLPKGNPDPEYAEVHAALSEWILLVDTIDSEVLNWMKEAVRHIGRTAAYGLRVANVIKGLHKHATKAPDAVGEIYLAMTDRILRDLHVEQDAVIATVETLYTTGHPETAKRICERITETGNQFLRAVYERYESEGRTFSE